ncbi:MAG: hypothetical protein D6781_00660 [Verrucomicrobia bacterium]|nr:MAG: hypothetical protein D6781_00660 [Verrucomicrobiota bacterium]
MVTALSVFVAPVAVLGQAPPLSFGGGIGAVSEPGGSFSFGVRFSGSTSVKFSGLGTLTSTLDSGDLTSVMLRNYHDGTVRLDQRAGAGSQAQIDDGFTDTWGFVFPEQASADGQSINFHTYSTLGEDTVIESDSSGLPGVDLELGWRIAGYGKRLPDTRRSGSWGVTLGFGVTDINAKTRENITATLQTLTDSYSVDGAFIPIIENVSPPYSSPSSKTVTIVNDDGTTSTISLDTSILLSNRPVTRTITSEPGAADIEGYWQIKGAAGTMRAGVWTRFYATRRLSLRASAGVSYSVLGYKMKYDERLFMQDRMIDELRETDESTSESHGVFGYYGSVDLEFWFTSKTGLFVSAVHEGSSSDLEIELGGRRAEIDVSGGTGFRFGITTMF